MRLSKLLDATSQDAVFGLRVLRKQRAFALTAVLTLALTIGGTTAMFTIIHAVLLEPLAYPGSDRLVSFSVGATPTRFAELKSNTKALTRVGAYTNQESLSLAGPGAEPEVLKATRVSANFLHILHVNPLLGRSFNDTEDSAGGPPVAIISARLWRNRFAQAPAILGQTATLSGTPYTIIGVLPPRFSFPDPDLDIWLTAPTEWPSMAAKSRALSPFLHLFGRLQPGVTLAQANAEIKVIQHQYALAHPTMLDARARTPEHLTAMKDSLVTGIRSTLWMLLGAVTFVLLIACSNVAGLLLAQSAARSHEMAIRAAIGAPRLRLIAQLLLESILLSLLGGSLGLLLAAWALRLVPHMTAFNLPRAQEIHLDGTILFFSATVSCISGALFGLAPAIGISRPDLIRVLRGSGTASARTLSAHILGRFSLRGILLVAQIALSVVLLIGTALLIESVGRLRGVSVGFNPRNILAVTVPLSPTRYDTPRKKADFVRDLAARLNSSPGVRSAAGAMLPMMGSPGTPVQDAAKPLLKLNERPIAQMYVTTPGYFRTLEIPLVRGRDFNERDDENAPRVAIVDESFARRFWPAYPSGIDPVGQQVWIGGINPKPARIIGIAADVHQNLENNGWPESVYVSFAQNSQPSATFALRTAGNPLSFAGEIRRELHALDPDQSMAQIQTMDQLMDEQVGQRRLLATLLASFAGVALLLVAIGLYGAIAYSVAQRTQEIGVRRALGAGGSDLLHLIFRESLTVTLVGIVMGIAGALGLTRLLRHLLFHVSATDPATFLFVAVVFVCVALLASYIPARRALRVDPVTALRI